MSAERVCCPECAAEIEATYSAMLGIGIEAAQEIEGTLYGPRTSYTENRTPRLRLTAEPLELALYYDAEAQSGFVECVRHCRILVNAVARSAEAVA